MLMALNDNKEYNTIPKELQIASEMHKNELEEVSKIHLTVTNTLKIQIKELKELILTKESTIRELTKLGYEHEIKLEEKNKELEIVRKELNERLRKLDEERGKLITKLEFDETIKTSNWYITLENMKTEHLTEIKKIKEQNENSINDIKKIFDQEKIELKNQLENAQLEITELKEKLLEKMNREYISNLDPIIKTPHDKLTLLKIQCDGYKMKIESLEEIILTLKTSLNDYKTIGSMQYNYRKET